MKTLWIVTTAALAAVPLLGSGTASPAQADLVRVQAMQPSEAIQGRMARLWEHRAILQNALQAPDSAGPAEPVEPQARALRPPEPTIVTAPQDRPVTQEMAGDGQVTCEAAARIVADFGFSDIGSEECSGDLYRFSAMRDGTAYAIAINAASGEIAEVSRQ